MYELTYKDVTNVLAELKNHEWYKYNTDWQLKTDDVVWCEEIK